MGNTLSPIETTEDQHIRIEITRMNLLHVYLKTKTLPFALIGRRDDLYLLSNGIIFAFENDVETQLVRGILHINTNQIQEEDPSTCTDARSWRLKGEQVKIGIAELNRRLQIRPEDDAIRFDDDGEWILNTPKPTSTGSILG